LVAILNGHISNIKVTTNKKEKFRL